MFIERDPDYKRPHADAHWDLKSSNVFYGGGEPVILNVRSLTKADIASLEKSEVSPHPAKEKATPSTPLMLIDCLYAPDEAEEIIGDLVQGFRRRGGYPRYRMIWLWSQTARLIFVQTMKLLRTYTQARAGK
jgi:hypothetical protein